jgi:hypothetical protein
MNMNFVIYYNITGRGHEKLFPHKVRAKDIKDAFKRALKVVKSANPKEDVDKFFTFFVVQLDENNKYTWNKSKVHGWDMGGKVSYPKGV